MKIITFRSPSRQYSKNIYKLFGVLDAPYIRTILGWSIFCIISISLFKSSKNLGSYPIFSNGITLTATNFEWSSLKNPRNTYPKDPDPNN